MPRSAPDRIARSLAAVCAVAAIVVPVMAPVGEAWGWTNGDRSTEPTRAGRGAVRVLIETIVVDGRGTSSAAQDEADIFPGQTGVLHKSITLKARKGSADPDEQVDLTIRVSASDQAQPFCPLLLSIVATGTPRGGPAAPPAGADRKAVSLQLQPGESRMTPAYVSPSTRARITLRITCSESQPAAVAGAPSSIAFDIALERGEDDAVPELLRSDRLAATLGGEAGSLFSSNLALPDSAAGERRYRRERLEVRVAPRIRSGDRLQVDITLRGEVATVSASGTDRRHPIDVEETVVLATGEARAIGVTVTAAGEEGWSSVQYLLRVTGRF